jgi:hypothetical protein
MNPTNWNKEQWREASVALLAVPFIAGIFILTILFS